MTPEELEAEAARLRGIAEAMEEAARRMRAQALTAGNQRGNQEEMVAAERLRHSKGTESVDPLVVAANAKGFTLRSLAEAVGKSHAFLSQGRRGKAFPRDLAEAIERLTGFKATRRNWPGLKG